MTPKQLNYLTINDRYGELFEIFSYTFVAETFSNGMVKNPTESFLPRIQKFTAPLENKTEEINQVYINQWNFFHRMI